MHCPGFAEFREGKNLNVDNDLVKNFEKCEMASFRASADCWEGCHHSVTVLVICCVYASFYVDCLKINK